MNWNILHKNGGNVMLVVRKLLRTKIEVSEKLNKKD